MLDISLQDRVMNGDIQQKTFEIQRRIGLGWAAFGKLKNTLKSKLPMCLKKKVFEQCVLPVITNGSETLTLTKGSAVKLQV